MNPFTMIVLVVFTWCSTVAMGFFMKDNTNDSEPLSIIAFIGSMLGLAAIYAGCK